MGSADRWSVPDRRGPSLRERVSGSAALDRRRTVARWVSRGLGRVHVEGLERVPTEGPVILAVNHRAFFDGVVLLGELPRPVSCLVKVEAFRGPLGPVLRSSAQIPVVRHRVDPAPVRLGVALLRAGGVLGIFPEGTRGDGSARTAKPGVGYFALRGGATVVPVALHGTERMVRRAGLRRPVVRLCVGAPLPIERARDDRPLNRRTVAATTETIRAALARLVLDTGALP